MSSILELASQLRMQTEAELRLTLQSCLGHGQGCDDYFDLSRVLLSRRELEPKIRALGASDLEALRSLKVTPNLVAANLATENLVLEEASLLAQELQPAAFKPTKRHGSYLSAYETLLSITELLFACERHWLDVIRAGIRSQDAKEVAQKLKLTPKDVQRKFQLACSAGLIIEHQGRWVASQAGMDWLELGRIEAWEALAASVWDIPDIKFSQASALEQITNDYPLVNLGNLKLLEFGADLGLLDSDTALYSLTLGNPAEAAKDIAKHLPEIQDTLLVQGDLSIVSPGPISTQLHRKLDTFADSEDLGLASRFRITTLSISHALETGMTIDQITDTLSQTADKPLPQPVAYVLEQTKTRFGQLKVLGSPAGTIVESTDTILITQIANEQSLRGLMLQPIAPGQLASKLSVDLIYFNLRDAGYAAVMFDVSGKIISPRTQVAVEIELAPDDLIDSRVSALMSGERNQMGGDDVLRQLLFAQKNKLMVQISVELQSGEAKQFTLSVLGVAAGRLRGKDQDMDAERTLPISRIQSVLLV